MKKKINKISNTKGFTLVETLIGLMILTIAIVAATSLLIGLIQSNKQIVRNLQAHYLAQEGLEAVRNIRDTNWLLNRDWIEGDGEFMGPIEIPDDQDEVNKYSIGFNFAGVQPSTPASEAQLVPTWIFEEVQGPDDEKIYLCGNEGDNQYFSSECSTLSSDNETEFTRHIEVSKPVYCGEDEDVIGSDLKDLCDNGKVMLVKSVVKFNGGEVSLEEILTDWKGGAL